MTAFSELGVLPEIVQAIEEIDWLLPTDVQAEAVPLILGGGDVLMAAETGSGKTGAFSLPVIQVVYETIRDRKEGKMGKRTGKSDEPEKLVMNVYDRNDALAISPDGVLCQSRDHKSWHGCRSTLGVTRGQYYYEAEVTDEGLCRVGWATPAATLELGKDRFGFGFGGTGKKSNQSQFDDYGEAFGKNDVIRCLIDLNENIISFTKNGIFLGDAFYISDNLAGEPFFAAVTLKNAEMKFNFGNEPFKCKVPAGYTAFCKAKNLVQPTRKVAYTPRGGTRLPSALIIEPSRELAQQTHDNIVKFKAHLPDPKVNACLMMGGESAKEQIRQLQKGVDIVTGTPGRLEDLINTNSLNLSNIMFFILDEADGLLSGGYGDLIQRIYGKVPKVSPEGRRLQLVVCSATLHSHEVKKLADRIMHFPIWIDLKGQDSVPDTVHHVVCMVDPVGDTLWHNLRQHVQTDGMHKKDHFKPGNRSRECLSEAVKTLKGEYLVRAIDEHKMDQAIIFCRTKLDCDNVEQYLLKLGGGKGMVNKYSCVCLHGDRRPQERKANLQAFKDGDVRFLICTDVAARGIDIQGIPFVINVTLPDDKQNYVHRIGRVGRADRMGLAISLVSEVPEKVWYHSNCPNRGKGCYNTTLLEQGGCAIWYNEKQYLAEIEEHLGETITQTGRDIKVPVNEFDGNVIYGQKRSAKGGNYKSHVEQLAPAVKELAEMEKLAQGTFLRMQTGQWFN